MLYWYTCPSDFFCHLRTSCIVSCFVLKYFCEIFTCTCPSIYKNICRRHDAWPGFFIFEGLICIISVNFTQKLVLYMSATAKASVKHVPLRHGLDGRLGVDDLTVRACHSGHARTTLVHTMTGVRHNRRASYCRRKRPVADGAHGNTYNLTQPAYSQNDSHRRNSKIESASWPSSFQNCSYLQMRHLGTRSESESERSRL